MKQTKSEKRIIWKVAPNAIAIEGLHAIRVEHRVNIELADFKEQGDN